MHNKTILWIEDDIDIISSVVIPLVNDGFNIIDCRNYSEALTHIKEMSKVDLILLDLILPSGNLNVTGDYLGLEFLRRLRHEFDIHIPVIVFSVIANARGLNEELKSLGAVLLSKPIRPSQLKSEVYEILGPDL
jgi:CheY-like chemotaxis protein